MKKYLYFAQAANAIKIGITVDLKHRLSELQYGSPVKVKYIYTFLSDPKEENKLHKRFEKYRLRGEWYQAEPILKYLKKVDDGIDISKIKTELEMNKVWKVKMKAEMQRLIKCYPFTLMSKKA